MRVLASLVLLGLGACVDLPPGPADRDPDPTPTPTAGDWRTHEGGLDDFELVQMPVVYALPEHPVPGGDVTVFADHPDAADIGLAPVGAGCGTLAASLSGLPPLELSGQAGATGDCRVTTTLQWLDGSSEVVEAVFAVRPLLGGAPPLEVDGAGWFPSPLLEADPTAPGPEVLGLTGATSFVNGQTVTWQVDWAGTEAPTAMLVAVEGFEGHFRRVLDPDAATAELSIQFAQNLFDQLPEARDGGVTLRVAMISGTARPRNVLSWAVNGEEVGSGSVQVGITWNTMTDVDLHVTEPSGEEIYYGHTTSATGGSLDLDSNPGCNIDGINAENIFWPEGAAPAGEYAVRVHMYSDCDLGNASGTLTVHHCGEDSPESFGFALGATGSNENFAFENPGCGYSVAGRVTYEDFVPGANGLVSAGYRASRFITVQAIRENGDVLGEARTDRGGNYLIRFFDPDDSTPTYKVRALATRDDWTTRQRVVSYDTTGLVFLDEELWAWETEDSFEASDEPQRTGVDLQVSEAQGGAALNIFDAGVTGTEYLRGFTGTIPPTITWYWHQAEGRTTGYSLQYAGIQVRGEADNPDEYDDTTLLHEYGHLVMAMYSVDDSGGGEHSVTDWEDPQMAWSEGWAHYFGAAASGSSLLANGDASADGYKWNFSLDRPPLRPADNSTPGMRLGTRGDALDGDMGELAVASILWDLHDATNETFDTVSSRDDAIWGVMTRDFAINATLPSDRGQPGRDLFDFLDAWIRGGYGDVGSTPQEGMRGIVTTLHGMTAYDFSPPP